MWGGDPGTKTTSPGGHEHSLWTSGFSAFWRLVATPPMMSGQPTVIAPQPAANQVDAVGARSGQEIARRIFEQHKRGLQARRGGLLIAEKLLIHMDGTGDGQWADIYRDQRVVIPRMVSEFRKTENVLRLIADHAVAYHVTTPLQFLAEASNDRRAIDKAAMDTMFANHLAYEQDFNNLFADALYLAMPAGFCPVHAYWRDDAIQDDFEPIAYGGEGGQPQPGGPAPGMIDAWVGNPFDTVFDLSSKRGSVLGCQYGRVLPADLVRAAFPLAAGLEGTKRLPSAAEFQRIARTWQMAELGVHGSPVMMSGGAGGRDTEEMISVICRETAPTRYEQGHLQIIVVPGNVDTMRGEGQGGNAVLVADQPLPGNDYSFTNVYSDQRNSDVYGKPWLEDKDQLQVDLNIALSKRWEVTNRMIEAPIVAPGGAIAEDMTDLGGYNLLEVEPSLATWRPRVMEWPQGILQALDSEIQEKRNMLYTSGGYQAVSRGESTGSRTPYRTILALQQADNTVHGPVNMRFKRSVCDFGRRCWQQMKAYGDVPWFIRIAGDQFAYLAEPYIDATKLSDTPPQYKLTNAFGGSPELRAQEVLELLQIRGADGQPLLRTEEARRAYPNHIVFDDAGDPQAVQRRRARTVASAFHTEATAYRHGTGLQEMDPANPQVQQAAQRLFTYMEQRYPRMRDDDLMAHLAAYSETTQDETADPIARQATALRQNMYFEWQAQMAGQMPYRPVNRATPGAPSAAGPETNTISRRSVGAEMQGGGESLQGAAKPAQ